MTKEKELGTNETTERKKVVFRRQIFALRNIWIIIDEYEGIKQTTTTATFKHTLVLTIRRIIIKAEVY